ncbi:MAG TPA: histidine kinase dimerization/phospho-acceptor domain-containing protein, partial [Gemmataceae bacterium]|nr:histidine kinase dimerization/phospho-acceptor domain-containing protein [Gemmataceae bacterium]
MAEKKTRGELEKEIAELRKKLRMQEGRQPRRSARLDGKPAAPAKAAVPIPPTPTVPFRAPGSESAETAIAAKIDKEIRHWTSIFVHEMNQPLSAILTTAQACRSFSEASGRKSRRRVTPQEMAEALGVLERQASYAGNLVRRLRDWAIDAPP